MDISSIRAQPEASVRLATGQRLASQARRWVEGLRRQALAVALLVLLLLLTLLPIVSVLVGSFKPLGLPMTPGWTIRHYWEIWSSPYILGLIANTLIFAVGSTCSTLLIAGCLAWLVERTDLPGRRYFAAGIILPMATPPLLLAIGWVLLTSPQIGLLTGLARSMFGDLLPTINIYSLGGMIFVQSLVTVPTSFMILAPVMRNMDPSFEEAAAMSGAGVAQTIRRVSLPFLTPAVMSLTTFLFIVGMLTFDVPAIIGMPGNVLVMSSEVYALMNPSGGLPDYGKSAALNSSLILILGNALAIYYYYTRQGERFSTVSGKAFRPRRFALGVWSIPAAGLVSIYFASAVFLPFLMIFWVSIAPYFSGFELALLPQVSLSNIARTMMLPRVWQGALNSLVVSAAAATVLTCLSLLVGWAIIRSEHRWTRLLDVLAMIPIAVPHLMMGVALVFIFFSLRALPIYGTVWIIALGHVIIFLPVGVRMMQAAILQLHKELEEAAIMAGASHAQSLRLVVIPLIRPTIISLFVWTFVHSFREFSVAVMLRSSNNEVLSTVLYSYWDNGQPEAATAISVCMMLTLGLAVLLAHRMSDGHNR